jgi:hypothetical protein
MEINFMWKFPPTNIFKKYGRVASSYTVSINGKYIPITVQRGLYSCAAWRLPHFFDSRLSAGDAAVSLTHQPPFHAKEY